MNKRRLITSALPYVNNIPHLGNLIQVLSADVFARFCRLRGYETLYVCGTDEYGTATETRAREEGITPQELCTRYYEVHDEIYRWFQISFDKFGRTSTPEHTQITQDIFLKLHKNGYITSHTIEQLYSEASDMFLADRYVRGTCPHCGYEDARGDQCEHCGKLLDPADLINPRSLVDNSTPVMRETDHLYIDLPKILPLLQEWMKDAADRAGWSRNAMQMTNAWIRDGLKERGITRDLKWGIPVPLEGYENKVFYVWFDAPIGYISITATLRDDWESWWKNPDNVELFQFIGKDNIPFHTVIFPCSLLGSGDNWTMLHHMSATEYLNYESGQFSKSRGVGVFGNDARDTGIPADVWRFYLFYNRPESSDFTFTWQDFQEKTNGELIGNLGNLVNRTLTFLNRFYDGRVVPAAITGEFWRPVGAAQAEITSQLEKAHLRDAFRKIFELSSYGNRTFQAAEPWKTRDTDPVGTHQLLSNLVYLIRDLAILCSPYIPATSERICGFLGIDLPDWKALGSAEGITQVGPSAILFDKLEDDRIAELQVRFSGTQAERAARDSAEAAEAVASAGGPTAAAGAHAPGKATAKPEQAKQPEQPLDERFHARVDLRAARITEVKRHPEAEKLYIEVIEVGEEEPRQIVSGLVPHYSENELLGKTIVLVSNLKPAKLRGEKSQGMLLAASAQNAEGKEIVEVLFLDDLGDVAPGSPVRLDGLPEPDSFPSKLKVEEFFSMPIRVEDYQVMVGGRPLHCNGKAVRTKTVSSGDVG
ncbi:MAG: methionine--tRNA ligase [Spirochaetaceae bacterium]|nr:MAG: methionine--tRNA ligase [Spirochaetaceae bacterium]